MDQYNVNGANCRTSEVFGTYMDFRTWACREFHLGTPWGAKVFVSQGGKWAEASLADKFQYVQWYLIRQYDGKEHTVEYVFSDDPRYVRIKMSSNPCCIQ